MKCVYCLEFADGKKYVGSTKNLKRRLRGHKGPSHNKKTNPELKEAILEGNYEVVILEQLPDSATKNDLREREQHYIDLWWYSGILYNRSRNAAGSDGDAWRGRKHAAESKVKISAAKKGTKHSEETKVKIGAAKKGPIWKYVKEIKALRESGLFYYKIAERYNCSFETIRRICLS